MSFIETRAGIKPSDAFLQEIEKLLGPECWAFGKHAIPARGSASRNAEPALAK
jgi:hypothetical protein